MNLFRYEERIPMRYYIDIGGYKYWVAVAYHPKLGYHHICIERYFTDPLKGKVESEIVFSQIVDKYGIKQLSIGTRKET